MVNKETAAYKIISAADGNRYCFYCDLSGAAICTTGPYRRQTPEAELTAAWETEGRSHFNHCKKCGKWVSDTMFNADVLECVACTPWESDLNYCPQCGHKLDAPGPSCPNCGVPFFDEGGRNDA